jgi:hypothetical protein
LRREAAQARDRIDRGACAIGRRIDRLKHRVRALARRPGALPVAFVCGILADRLHVPGIKYAYGLVADQVKAMQIASGLIGSSIR